MVPISGEETQLPVYEGMNIKETPFLARHS